MKRIYTFLSLCIAINMTAQDFDKKNLEDYIEFRARKERYSGITQIYKDDQLVFESIKGLANRSWSIPNKSNTRFDLASVTKMFTATGIGILADLGKIELNEPFLAYFPDFPNKALAGQVTVKALLGHTSGLSDFFFDKQYLESDRSRLRKLVDYDPFLTDIKKGDVPADRIAYSNTNYIILGRIIEHVSGQDFYTFVDEMIFKPTGMVSSGFFEGDLVIPNLADGYFRDAQAGVEFGVPNDGQVRKNTWLRGVKGMPAGGAFATAADMQIFVSALKSGALLKKNTFKKMTDGNPRRYGLGFQSYRQNEIQVWGHSGGFYGVSTMVFHLPESGYTFISLTNTDFGAQPVFDRFINLLSGRPTYSPTTVSASTLQDYEGFFEVYEGEMLSRQTSITAKEDRLLFDNELEFFPIGKDQFFDIDNDLFTLTFKRDRSGKVTGFVRTDNSRFTQKARKIKEDQVRTLQALQVGDDVLAQYLGDYEFGEGGMMPGHKPQVEVDKGALTIDNIMRFLPYEKDKFFQEGDIGMRLEFQRDAAGSISGIHVLRETQIIGRVKKLN